MIRWALRRAIDTFKREWNSLASYLRETIGASPRAARRSLSAARPGNDCRDVPIEAFVAAGITAVRSEGCGPCTQLATAMAERWGVRPEILRAILKGDVAAMREDVALAWRFTRAILAPERNGWTADDYRAVILERWGPRAVATLEFPITTAMGHGKACTRVVVRGAPVTIDRELTSKAWGPTPEQSHARST
jgi:hypothetical protein